MYSAVATTFQGILGSPACLRVLAPGVGACTFTGESLGSFSMVDEGIEIQDGHDEGSGAIYNRIRLGTTGISISNDCTGLFPAYYAATDLGFAAASHLHLLAKALAASVDEVGEYEFRAMRYTIGTRTLYAGIKRLRPASHLTFSLGGSVAVTERPHLYVDRAPMVDRREAPAAVWDGLRAAARRSYRPDGPMGVFLSGGLDSRMVIAAMAAEGIPLVAVTHGQAYLQETKMAQRVASVAAATHYLVDVDESPDKFLGTETDLLDTLWRSDHVLFPVWRLGAQLLSQQGVSAACSGYMLDASLGGHFHDPATATARLRRRFRVSLRAPDDADERLLSSERYVRLFIGSFLDRARASLEYESALIAKDRPDDITGCVDAIRSSVEAELAHIVSTGTSNPARIVERFLAENHARKMSFSQELVARRWVAAAVPMADPQLLELLSSLPSHWLLDHHLYFKVIRKFARPYAKIPASNSSLPVTAPTIALEAARMFRSRYDRWSRRRYVRMAGKRRSRARFGSINYDELLRRPGALTPLYSLLGGGTSSAYEPAMAKRWLKEIETFERNPLNMTSMTSLLTLRIAESARMEAAKSPWSNGWG